MDLIITGAELFGSGTATRFKDLEKDSSIKEKALEFTKLAGVIRTAHIAGSPNKSRFSTENAEMSARALISGLTENIREAVQEFRGFFKKK